MFQEIKDTEAMLELGARLSLTLFSGAIIFLYGDLGAGKTTFTRGFLRGLGLKESVKSPTYTLVESYEIDNKKIYHFDFYRVKDSQELIYIGLEEYFTADSVCLVEWPERGIRILPKADISCYIAIHSNERTVKLVAESLRGKTMLERLL